MLDPLDFLCPACGAKPGEACTTITQKRMSRPHAKRRIAALDKEHPRENLDPTTTHERNGDIGS